MAWRERIYPRASVSAPAGSGMSTASPAHRHRNGLGFWPSLLGEQGGPGHRVWAGGPPGLPPPPNQTSCVLLLQGPCPGWGGAPACRCVPGTGVGGWTCPGRLHYLPSPKVLGEPGRSCRLRTTPTPERQAWHPHPVSTWAQGVTASPGGTAVVTQRQGGTHSGVSPCQLPGPSTSYQAQRA